MQLAGPGVFRPPKKGATELFGPENRDNFEENSEAYYNESQQLPR
jgi:hypothetical protein